MYNDEYDIEKAFKSIEDELIASMIRNLKDHKAWEEAEGFNWEMWQVKQLESLEQYKKANRKKFKSKFSNINSSIDSMIKISRQEGSMKQEIAILKAIKKGHVPVNIPVRIEKIFKEMEGMSVKKFFDKMLHRNATLETTGEFFKLNTRKLNALATATKNDLHRAEFAMLRQANDQYRKIIYNAQVYANTGAATYEKAVDMATKDFLSKGIQCIEYSNGSRHTIQEYSKMAIRTANKRAYLTGEGEKRAEWGEHLVRINKRGNACPKCLPFVGKVLIDDVWSGGSSKDGTYPLMSRAIELGLYHPNCKDVHSTYFEGISSEPEPYTKDELKKIEKDYKEDQELNYAKKQSEKFGRLEKYSIDPDNKKAYASRKEQWNKMIENTGKSDIIKVSKVNIRYEPNSITEIETAKGGITRNYYGADGKQTKQISNNNHGTPKSHPWGINGEHAHDYIWENDNLIDRPGRELTNGERKENSDIL